MTDPLMDEFQRPPDRTGDEIVDDFRAKALGEGGILIQSSAPDVEPTASALLHGQGVNVTLDEALVELERRRS